MGNLFDIGVEKLMGGGVAVGRGPTASLRKSGQAEDGPYIDAEAGADLKVGHYKDVEGVGGLGCGTYGEVPQDGGVRPPLQEEFAGVEASRRGKREETEPQEGGIKPPLQSGHDATGAPWDSDHPGSWSEQKMLGGTFYLETFGCQMNEHDSEKVAGVLLARGYKQVESAEAANVVLYNTCSIREKAAQKVFSRLGEWRERSGEWRAASGEIEKDNAGTRSEQRFAGKTVESLKLKVESEKAASASHGMTQSVAEREEAIAQGRSAAWAEAQGLQPSLGVMSDPSASLLQDLKMRARVASLGETQEGDVKAPLREEFADGAGRDVGATRDGRKIIGVLGCLAQQEGEKIFARAPWVSLVCGSASYRKLPELLVQLEMGNRRVTGLETDTDETFETEVTRRDNPWRAYLTIIEGCDKKCSFCVVPYTRGPERSRASTSILDEVRKLADVGYTEVQLLGQTVNSYKDPSARKMRFSELLVAAAEVAGIRRVRFTTSHPRDFGKDIVEAIEAVPAICEHVHLPVQSGSTRVLRAMARTYTRDEYLEKVAMLRGAKREISLTTDLIVGFPGETEKDFEETLSLLDVAQYDGAFSFKYSPRPNTPSLKMEDAIPEEEKSRRLAILMEKQREIQRARNGKLVGRELEVMVEGKSQRDHPSGVRASQWSGHTSSNKVMNFTSREEESLGDYVQVKVVAVTPNSLVGERIRHGSTAGGE